MTTFNDKVILITGGTGSFGKKFVEVVLKRYKPKKLIVFSRDELKQFEMQKMFGGENVRYFIGNVRDKERLMRAFHKVDVVVHAAALKQIPALEYNPFEAVKTNIIGAENIVEAAIDNGVKRVIAISTDKAVNPINLYGATKLCSDKIFVAANSYSGDIMTRFSVVRYGNVFNSRGSVVPFFREESKKGVLPITDKKMTRFWITLEKGIDFVLKCLRNMSGGEIFIPKIPSVRIVDLAGAIAPHCRTKVVGIRPGEKLHEVLVSRDDVRNTIELRDMYVLLPAFRFWDKKGIYKRGKRVKRDFEYASNTNENWLSIEDLKEMLEK